ncbi:uncharacterized protein LOC132038545 [Lycium ferocissimum]|uniref:uncharacterized protein LOC132038545 n=1 Tax=Lycium ferocissimum TaxID=112874 RepID=UPI0028154AEE|nr:uncharacterized protein LOC132038545 [Lycium ferocissimum]
MKQKSRDKWIKLGDSSTKYFSAVTKEKNQRKHIVELTSLAGVKLTNPVYIQNEIVQFYQGLMGTAARSLPPINKITMRNGPALSHEQQQGLCVEVTEAEICAGLKDIGDDKSPGTSRKPTILLNGCSHFPEKFIAWLMECIQTVHYSIIVNGEPTPPFNAAKGLRQGDPISPYLFAIAMEYLSRNLKGLKQGQGFRFHPKCSKLKLTHLCFADDLLLFTIGDLTSDYKLTLTRVFVYFGGVALPEQNRILTHLGYTKGTLPFRYLGVPLLSKKLTLMQWQPLIQKMTSKISGWTAKKLSYADAICRSYVWSGVSTVTKKALISWDKWMIGNGTGKSQASHIFQIIYTEACHAVWLERNQRVFEKRSRDIDVFVREVVYICNVRASRRCGSLVQSWMLT